MTDEQRLQGKWVPVSGHLGGKELTAEQLAKIAFRFDGKVVELTDADGASGKVLFAVDSNRQPTHINFIVPDGKKSAPGIFTFVGNRLKLAMLPCVEGVRGLRS